MREQKGFTLIELLVVILIIAILAAIAIPVFLNQRQKGWESQVQSALKNAGIAVESYLTTTEAGGGYVGLNGQECTGSVCSPGPEGGASISTEGYRGAAEVTITINAGLNSYCIQGRHSSMAGRVWSYSQTADPGAGVIREAACV